MARRRGRLDVALTSYRRAVEELQSVQQDNPVEYRDGRSSYRRTLVGFGDELRRFTAPIPEATLRDEVRHFGELLEKRAPNQYLVPA